MNSNILKQATNLGDALIARGWKVACAESCTGGGVAQAITEVAGSSQWFDLGVVTYSNAMKTQVLNVPQPLLDAKGAVSEPVAKAMVVGVLRISGADVAAAVSGVAGPGGGTHEKPVGTVYIAWGNSRHVYCERYTFEGGRAQVRRQSVEACLAQLAAFVQPLV